MTRHLTGISQGINVQRCMHDLEACSNARGRRTLPDCPLQDICIKAPRDASGARLLVVPLRGEIVPPSSSAFRLSKSRQPRHSAPERSVPQSIDGCRVTRAYNRGINSARGHGCGDLPCVILVEKAADMILSALPLLRSFYLRVQNVLKSSTAAKRECSRCGAHEIIRYFYSCVSTTRG